MTRLFVYGTLRSSGRAFPRLLEGHVTSIRRGVLRDHALYGFGLPYPYVAPEPGWRVVGEVMTVPSGIWARLSLVLDAYEGPEYQRVELGVETDIGRMTAATYVAHDGCRLDPGRRLPSGEWIEPAPR